MEPSLAVHQDIGRRCLWITRYFSEEIGMHFVLYKVKIKWNRWVTAFHLWLPPELHVWHHALPRLNQWHGRVFVRCCCLRVSCSRNGVRSCHLLVLFLCWFRLLPSAARLIWLVGSIIPGDAGLRSDANFRVNHVFWQNNCY